MGAIALKGCWLIVLTSIAPAYLAGQKFGLLTMFDPVTACVALTIAHAVATWIFVRCRAVPFLLFSARALSTCEATVTITTQRQNTDTSMNGGTAIDEAARTRA